MLKFATAQIIAASLGDQQERFSKAAHRAVFQYDARPGYLYVRSRAISSRCNDNHDEFPATEIAKAYATFVGKPVFVNHHNENHRRARGVIIDAALHEDRNPDGTPDTWAEVLMEIDAKQFPKLAKAIIAGDIDRTSMGCDVERSVCSACGNEATTPAEYCAHIPGLKGKRIFRHTASGQRVGELVRETCYGLSFFENSVLVEPPADPTAHFLGVDSTGLGKAASKSAAVDFSAFEDRDELEADDDGEDVAPKPTPVHPAPRPKPAAPCVPADGTTPDRQRRQDAITRTKPFTPLKPSLNTRAAGQDGPKSYPWTQTYQGPNGYEDRENEVQGPLYHGGGARWRDGQPITPGRKPHPESDESGRSQHVYFTNKLDTAADYAHRSGGHVFEVEPTGNFLMDHNENDFKTKHPLTVTRRLDPSEWQSGRTAALHAKATSTGPFSWDEIGERHPHVYGDPEFHGEAAEGADGEGIGSAANHLAHDRPEDPDAEGSDVHSLEFHLQHINPRHIDFQRHGGGDGRVESARQGYSKNPGQVPPLVLVHRHGVYQVADGHHRAQAAYESRMDSVPAYVAHSPHPKTPFSDGAKGPFHSAETAPRQRTRPARTRAQAPAAQPQWEQQKLFAKQVEAAKPQFENPGDHPWFKETGLSHEHVLHHWDQATDEEKKQGARWYPDAHHVAKAIAKLNPDITDDSEAAHKGAGVLSAYSPQQNWWANQHNAARSFVNKKAVGKGEGLMVMGSHATAAQKILDGEDHQKVLKGPKTQDFAHLIEHGGNDEHGQPSRRVVMDRHALSVAAGRRLNADDAKGFPSGNRHYYEHAAEHYRTAAAVISDREGRHVPPHEVQAVTWLTRQRLNAADDEGSPGGKGRQTVQRNQRQQWKDLAGEHTPQLKDDGNSHVAKVVDAVLINADGSISAVAYGEIKAPQDVDTLREENCPVCGDADTYDGMTCQVCGFVSPPEQFRDPDLGAAKRMDLRKQVVDPSLVDDNGELQRVDSDGTAMPGAEEGQQDPGMVDPDQLDENGLPPSPFGDQSLDGTQEDGPAVSDRNGDGMIQPGEIDPGGNVNAQDQVDPEMGGQAAPRELPYAQQDHTGQPFTPGPDVPRRPDEPEGPDALLGQEDGQQAPGLAAPEPMTGQPGDGVSDLKCPSCGFNADATPPQTQNMGNPMAGSDGVVAGDVCPNCQRAQLLTPGEMNGQASAPPPVIPRF
ncbi:ParB/RepB/Spo0J family partition protein [Streptomyces sp. cg35]|uniref:ParB/RepB/Spo0J family partition protein n=1 Tax=Streptomyces sp. cg35 TaxID=3421650 RepID=UPI003D16ECF3